MHALPLLNLPPLAAIFDLSPYALSLAFAFLAMLIGCAMGMVGMYFSHQRQRLWHETARIALEKGQPVPLQSAGDKPDRDGSGDDLRSHDLRGGLVLVAVGVGLYMFLLISVPNSNGFAFLGAIPGFIGVALLLHYALTAWLRSKKSDSKPPRS